MRRHYNIDKETKKKTPIFSDQLNTAITKKLKCLIQINKEALIFKHALSFIKQNVNQHKNRNQKTNQLQGMLRCQETGIRNYVA